MYDDKMLIDIDEMANLLGVAVSSVRRHEAAGKIPAPVHLGSRVLWRRREIEEWVHAGLPPRDEWEGRKGGDCED